MTGSGADNSPAGTAKPVLRLVRGHPTPEELGAVVALLAARSGGDIGKPDVTTPSLWGTPQLRGTLSHGTGAWKASGLPR